MLNNISHRAKLVWKLNISSITEVKILPQMIISQLVKKHDCQIKCHQGCCIFNTHSCLLIPLLYLPLIWAPRPTLSFLLPPKTETNQHSDYFGVYLLLTSFPITSTIFLPQLPLVWARLSAHCYQSSPLTVPKWGEKYLPPRTEWVSPQDYSHLPTCRLNT